MKKYIFLFVITVFVPFVMLAQDLVDALRYSDLQVQGTARAGAMGNAFGALGGDFTSASINPAGIGLYRSSELTVTPIFGSTRVETNYLGTNREESDFKFSLNNLSYVYSLPIAAKNEAGIVSINFGVGYNRIKDLNSDAVIQGYNVIGSYMDQFSSNANKDNWNDMYEELAWQTYMLNERENGEYYSEMQDAEYEQSLRKTHSKNGSIDEYSFVMGINFNYKLYIGMAWGINDLSYSEGTTIYEKNDNGNIPNFNNYQFNSYLSTYGTGHNFKFGLIYKPINQLRLGISIHTPTFYHLYDDFNTSMYSSVGRGNYEENSPYNEFNYQLQTPMRTTFSGAYVIGKKGLISVDYELVDYGKAKLKDGDFYDENQEIMDAYKTSGNLRIGGEFMATNNFSLRGGFEYHGPSIMNIDNKLLVYSTGIGYRTGLFFADLAYRYSTIQEYFLPYELPSNSIINYPEPQAASFNTIKNDVLFTIGFKF